jgi:hypothetical protein
MVNIQVRNSETMSLNVEFHIAELQFIPREVYEIRTSGGQGQERLTYPAGRAYPRSPNHRSILRPPEYNGHMNYVLWRDLRGK